MSTEQHTEYSSPQRANALIQVLQQNDVYHCDIATKTQFFTISQHLNS